MKNLKRISAVIMLFCVSGFSNGYAANEPSQVTAVQGQGPEKGIEPNQDIGMNEPRPGNKENIVAQSPDQKMEAGPLSRPANDGRECHNGNECARPEEPRKPGRGDIVNLVKKDIARPVAIQGNKENRKIEPENTGIDRRFQNLARPEDRKK